MGDVSYRPLIDEMVWSYSRLDSFNDCPYRWFLKYIKHCKDSDKFYASYGSFMHKLIEMYYRGEIKKDDMLSRFLSDFKKEVRGLRPKQSIVENYIRHGCDYLSAFQPFRFNMVDVEKRVEFSIGVTPFVGFIDYIGEENGEYVIVDNKSRDLKPRSNRSIPTKKDEELDIMLRQLYLYSAAVKQEYGKFPKLLCFNCFRTGVFIEEPFVKENYIRTIEWAEKQIEDIKREEDFIPYIDFFSCRFICGVNNECEYYEIGCDYK